MGNDNTNETKGNEYAWEPNRKSAATLPSSEHGMDDNRREIIRQALDLDIIDVRSYAGYRGDMLVEFTTMDKETVNTLHKIADTLGMEVVVRQDPLMVYQVYCISPNDTIYDLA